MATKYSIERVIYSNDYNEDDFQSWAKDMREYNGYNDVSEETLRQWYYDDMDQSYHDEKENLNEYIDGYIIALGSRWSHYGVICGNGRTGMALAGDNLRDIFMLHGDIIKFWGQDYNIQARSTDHDGTWNVTFRVCKSEEEAEKFMEKGYSNDEIMDRTKSLYPYIAKIYGWPYRKTNKGAA